MQHDDVRRALLVQHAQHVGVRVPIVDHERLAEPLRQRDVRAKARFLRHSTVVAGPERVQPGLADRPYPRLGGQALDDPQRLVQLGRRGRREPGRLVRMQRDRRDHRRVVGRERDAPPRRRHVTADLDHARHADGGGRRDLRRRIAADDVEVRVAVQRRHRERLGRRRELALAAMGRADRTGIGVGHRSIDHCGAPSRASSSSTMDGSSLRNTGFGACSGVPASIATCSQRAPCV